jgi:hypothetical protein
MLRAPAGYSMHLHLGECERCGHLQPLTKVTVDDILDEDLRKVETRQTFGWTDTVPMKKRELLESCR